MATPEHRQGSPAATIHRMQRWACHAYACIDKVQEGDRRDYKIAVNDLGASILRSGLSAALAALQRKKERALQLLEHLAGAGVTGLAGKKGTDLPAAVRALDADGYILATREMLQVAAWLKRAVQATFED